MKYAAILVLTVAFLCSGLAISQAETTATITSIDPLGYQGKCPITIKIHGKITSTSSGDVGVECVFSDRYETSSDVVKFSGPGSMDYLIGS